MWLTRLLISGSNFRVFGAGQAQKALQSHSITRTSIVGQPR